MRILRSAVLYTAMILGANAALADSVVPDQLRTGEMELLTVHETPIPLPEAELLDATDAVRDLGPYAGKIVLINFWATWCAPCRAELASLDRLQAELGDEDFAVVTIATGPNPVPAIERLFADEAIAGLPVLRDPQQGFARDMGVLGLPVSVLVDRDGREIARLTGGAEWDSPDAKALVAALIAAP